MMWFRCSRCGYHADHARVFGPNLCEPCKFVISVGVRVPRTRVDEPTDPSVSRSTPAQRIRLELQQAGWGRMRALELDVGPAYQACDLRGAYAPVRDVTEDTEPADLRPRPMPVPEEREPSLLSVAWEWALDAVLDGELDAFELMSRPKGYGRRRLPNRESTDESFPLTPVIGWRGANPRHRDFGVSPEGARVGVSGEGRSSVSRGQVFPPR